MYRRLTCTEWWLKAGAKSQNTFHFNFQHYPRYLHYNQMDSMNAVEAINAGMGKMSKEEELRVGKKAFDLSTNAHRFVLKTVRNLFQEEIFSRIYYQKYNEKAFDNLISYCKRKYIQRTGNAKKPVKGRIAYLSPSQIKQLTTNIENHREEYEATHPGDLFYIKRADDMIKYFNEVANADQYFVGGKNCGHYQIEPSQIPPNKKVITVSYGYCNIKREFVMNAIYGKFDNVGDNVIDVENVEELEEEEIFLVRSAARETAESELQNMISAEAEV